MHERIPKSIYNKIILLLGILCKLYMTFYISYQEKDILTLQAMSTIDLIRVVCHRKRLTVEKSSEG